MLQFWHLMNWAEVRQQSSHFFSFLKEYKFFCVCQQLSIHPSASHFNRSRICFLFETNWDAQRKQLTALAVTVQEESLKSFFLSSCQCRKLWGREKNEPKHSAIASVVSAILSNGKKMAACLPALSLFWQLPSTVRHRAHGRASGGPLTRAVQLAMWATFWCLNVFFPWASLSPPIIVGRR